ncbi:MAG: hypothetical protein GWP03_06470 [Proteobacteria bacterium]|nr:hypothetical protein [Pseudomonadota bacterium]
MEFLKTQKREYAIDNFIRNLSKVRGSENVSLKESFGRIIAENIIAQIDVPSYSRSTVDGYACISGLT